MRPRTVLLLLVLLAVLASQVLAATRWIPSGPNGGAVAAVAAGGPSGTPGTLLALSRNAGAYVSRDGGSLWISTAPGPQGTEPSPGDALAHVSATGALFVSDLDAELWRSRNGGETWQSLRSASALAGAGPAVTDLDTATADPEQVVALFVPASGGHALPFRSRDGGDTWEPLSGFPADAAANLIRFDPQNGARLIASTSRGVFWSDDDGQSWHESNLRKACSSLALERGSRGRVYALAFNGDIHIPRSTVYTSLDHGRTFLTRATLSAAQILAVDPAIPGGLYASDFLGQIQRSTNAGRSFVLRARLGRFPVLSLVTDASGTAYAAIPAGPFGRSILRSRDHGATWAPAINGIHAADVLALAPSPDGSRWWAGLGSVIGSSWAASHSGLWSLDGTVWRLAGLRQLSVRALSPHPVLADEIIAATLGGGIARSKDGGATWSAANPTGIFVADVDRDPTEPRHVLATADRGVAVSHDGGAEWSPLGTVHTGPHLRFSHDGSAFYASLAPGEIFSENDVDALARFAADGTSKTNLLAVSGRIQAILPEVDPSDSIWVGTARYDGSAFVGSIDHTIDGGAHWERHLLPGGTPALSFGHEPGGRLLVGSTGAVHATANGGETWTTVGAGLPPGVWVTVLVLGADGRWRAGTLGAGVFVLSDES